MGSTNDLLRLYIFLRQDQEDGGLALLHNNMIPSDTLVVAFDQGGFASALTIDYAQQGAESPYCSAPEDILAKSLNLGVVHDPWSEKTHEFIRTLDREIPADVAFAYMGMPEMRVEPRQRVQYHLKDEDDILAVVTRTMPPAHRALLDDLCIGAYDASFRTDRGERFISIVITQALTALSKKVSPTDVIFGRAAADHFQIHDVPFPHGHLIAHLVRNGILVPAAKVVEQVRNIAFPVEVFAYYGIPYIVDDLTLGWHERNARNGKFLPTLLEWSVPFTPEDVPTEPQYNVVDAQFAEEQRQREEVREKQKERQEPKEQQKQQEQQQPQEWVAPEPPARPNAAPWVPYPNAAPTGVHLHPDLIPLTAPPPSRPLMGRRAPTANTKSKKGPTMLDLPTFAIELRDANPVTKLHELCMQLNWPQPVWECEPYRVAANMQEAYVYRVTVNDQTWQTAAFRSKKQTAKTDAARLAFHMLGILELPPFELEELTRGNAPPSGAIHHAATPGNAAPAAGNNSPGGLAASSAAPPSGIGGMAGQLAPMTTPGAFVAQGMSAGMELAPRPRMRTYQVPIAVDQENAALVPVVGMCNRTSVRSFLNELFQKHCLGKYDITTTPCRHPDSPVTTYVASVYVKGFGKLRSRWAFQKKDKAKESVAVQATLAVLQMYGPPVEVKQESRSRWPLLYNQLAMIVEQWDGDPNYNCTGAFALMDVEEDEEWPVTAVAQDTLTAGETGGDGGAFAGMGGSTSGADAGGGGAGRGVDGGTYGCGAYGGGTMDEEIVTGQVTEPPMHGRNGRSHFGGWGGNPNLPRAYGYSAQSY